MNSSDRRVFVYGTLKPGGHYWPEFCQGKVAEPIPAKIHGQLYDLHLGYPGLKLESTGWVLGYLLEFAQEVDFLRLDSLEGYAPNRDTALNEYNRLKVDCFDRSGARLDRVWCYEMSEATAARQTTTLIKDGNWPI